MFEVGGLARLRLRHIRNVFATFYLQTQTHRRTKQTSFVWPNTINQTRQKNKTTARVVIFFGGSGWIRTTSVVRQQIYSLPRLSNSGARPIPGASSGTRTRISSLEGLRTSPCTMLASNSKQTDYILISGKIKI